MGVRVAVAKQPAIVVVFGSATIPWVEEGTHQGAIIVIVIFSSPEYHLSFQELTQPIVCISDNKTEMRFW